MFNRARLKLTGWYVLMVMIVSILFSLAVYRVSTWEIERLASRLEQRQQEWRLRNRNFAPLNPPGAPSPEELESARKNLAINLVMINGLILVVTAGSAYVLSGKTLLPIQNMLEMQREFVANASHELKTPLAILSAQMEIALLGPKIDDKKARQLIRSNLEEVKRLTSLSNSLLDLVKAEQVIADRQTSRVNLDLIVGQVIKRLKPIARLGHIEIRSKLEPVVVEGQVESLTTLTTILVENAIKYTRQNTTVDVDLLGSGKFALLKVTDQGRGIEAKEISQIFNRFYRASSDRANKPGFGLGLAIAQQIVENYHGTIKVNSISGQGSQFLIRLPVRVRKSSQR